MMTLNELADKLEFAMNRFAISGRLQRPGINVRDFIHKKNAPYILYSGFYVYTNDGESFNIEIHDGGDVEVYQGKTPLTTIELFMKEAIAGQLRDYLYGLEEYEHVR